MELQSPGSPILMVGNNPAIHRKVGSKVFPSTPGKFWLLCSSFILGLKIECYKSWVSLSEQIIIYNELDALKLAFY